jgi:hypothetical protein
MPAVVYPSSKTNTLAWASKTRHAQLFKTPSFGAAFFIA